MTMIDHQEARRCLSRYRSVDRVFGPMTGAAIPANSSDVQSKGWSRISRRQLKHATFVIAAVSGVVTAADRGEMKVALR
jgi:hypothetical protein